MKKRQIISNIIFLAISFIFLQIFISSLILYNASLTQTRKYLTRTIKRVSEDVKYNNGKWDTSLYNADGTVPDINPLYIITTDGFIIERWKPIHGLLDVSEFNKLIAYTQPETISTITNENWRILSKPIVNNGSIIGVITASAYKPEQNDIQIVDQQLTDTTQSIRSDLKIKGDVIDTSSIDARQFPYTITFQVVNRFNKLLIQNDNTTSITRSPTFIDSSYVDDQIGKKEEVVKDTVTNQRFLVFTSPIYDQNNSVVGIIVAGSPIDTFYDFNNKYVLTLFFITFLLACLFVPLVIWLFKKYLQVRIQETKNILYQPKGITFSKKQCRITIDNQTIPVPYASYQYYFCDALFAKPTKRWEVDELLDIFGEKLTPTSWRKAYDTMVALNKKTQSILGKKLFIIHEKTYSINPLYIPLISYNKT